MRRLEMDKEIQEKKVAKLQKDLLNLDRQKYQAELKAQESVTSMRQMQKQSSTGVKEMIGLQSSTENKLLKAELELKKANAQIEKLQDQLRHSLGRHPSAQNFHPPQTHGGESARKSPPMRSKENTEEKARMQ